MMELFIRVDVKFRFLLRDLAKFEETYRVAVGAGGLEFQQVHEEMPARARRMLDRNGVKVYLW